MSNSLSAVHPELVAEWSDRNLPLTPDSITFGSNKKVWWKGACGHEWETSVKARSNGEKCPICSGARVVTGINDLSTLKSELASEWSEKNKIKPTEVSIGSHKKVIWKCKLEHEWIATVKSRSINRTGCPYCSHNKVLAGFNDLATLFPEVADEWSDKNEKKPTEVIDVCGTKMAYQVKNLQIIKPEEVDCLNIEAEKDLVSLVTCTPYGINTHRLVVTGERISYQKGEEKKIKGKMMSVRELLFAAMPVVFICYAIVNLFRYVVVNGLVEQLQVVLYRRQNIRWLLMQRIRLFH